MAGSILDFLNGVASKLLGGSSSPAPVELKVGFIDGAEYPDGTKVAMVAARNEYGDPGHNQPPRPFFRNAISEKSEDWANSVTKGIRAGNSVEQVLNLVGEVAVGDVKESIATLIDPPLSDATIRSRRSRKVLRNNSTKPLVDTKVMIGDVTHKVSSGESS